LTDAEICEDLGVVKGEGAGLTDDYLAKGTTRLQAAIMYLRMIGKEAEALAYEGEENFDDAADVAWAGGKAILGYLKANPDLGWTGVGGNKFDPNSETSAQMMYKVALEALGYKQGTDFEWADVFTFAADNGLSKAADLAELTNNDMCTIVVEMLGIKVKDSDKTLIEKLVADGVVTEEAAEAAGLVSGAVALDVKGAVALNSKIVEVSLNTAATAKDLAAATFAVKDADAKEVAVAGAEIAPWSTDSKSVLVTLEADTTAGTLYTLTVGEKVVNFGGMAKDTTKPTVTEVKSTDFDKVKITFSEAVKIDGLVVAVTEMYGSKAALNVASIAYDGSNAVVLTTDDQKASTLYGTNITGAADLAGNVMDKDDNDTFVGTAKSTAELKVELAKSNDPEEVVVKFNEKVDTATILAEGFKVEEMYGTKAVLAVTAARLANKDEIDADGSTKLTDTTKLSRVILTVPGLKNSTMYKVTVSGMKTLYGVAQSTTEADTYKTFVGTAKPTDKFGFAVPTTNSNTSISVKFDRKVKEEIAETIANYAIVEMYGDKAALAVTAAELQSDGKTVKLTVASMKETLYKITVSNIVDIYDNGIKTDSDANVKTFVGAKVADKISSITSANLDATGTVLTVVFNKNVDSVQAVDISHYSISDGVGYPAKAEYNSDTPDTVKLTVPKTTDGKSYTLTVKGLNNSDGVAMDTAGITASFVGKGNAATLPEIQGAQAISNSKLEVFFDRSVDDSSVKNRIWSDALNGSIVSSNIVVTPDYTGASAITITGVYKNPANANSLILVAAANSFAPNQNSKTYNTLTLKGVYSVIKGNTATTDKTLTVATSGTATYGPKMIGVMANTKQSITVFFDQPVSSATATAFTAFSDTGMTYDSQASNKAVIDANDKTKVNVFFANEISEASASTSKDNQFMLKIGTLANVKGFGGISAADDSDGTSNAAKSYQSIAFAGSTTTIAAGLDSGIYGVFSDKRNMTVMFPEPMDDSTIAAGSFLVKSYVGSAETTPFTPAYMTYDAATNSAKAYFTTDVVDSTSGVTEYKLEVATSVKTQEGVQVCASKTASPLTKYYSQVAVNSNDAGKPAIDSVSVDDSRRIITVKFDREVVFEANPDFTTGDANDDDNNVINDSSPLAVTATEDTVAPYFSLKATRGDGTAFDEALSTDNAKALYVVTDGIKRNTDNKSITIELNAALQSGTNAEVKLLTGAAVYSWNNVQQNTESGKETKAMGGATSSPLYDDKAPVYCVSALAADDKVLTLKFDENIVSNVADLKAVITFAANGIEFSALNAADTVAISGNTIVITFNTALTGTDNKVTIDASSLKDAYGNVLDAAVNTAAIDATAN